MRPTLVTIIGLIVALWMSAGRYLFGIGGTLTLWYLPTLGLVYVLVHIWIAKRIKLTHAKERSTSRGTIVSLILSWVSGIGFGIMAPDMVDGQLVTIATHLWGEGWYGMAIALSNTLGILALTFAGSAVGFSIADSRDPQPEEEFDGPIPMPKHPLS